MLKKKKAIVKNKANKPKGFIEYWRSYKSIRYSTYIAIVLLIIGIIYSDWSTEKSHINQTTSIINNQQNISQKTNENLSDLSQQIKTIQNRDLEELLKKEVFLWMR